MTLVVEEMDANFREERKMKRSGFLAGLREGIHALATAGQWKQIDEDETFKRYLLYFMLSTAGTINNKELSYNEVNPKSFLYNFGGALQLL